MSQRAFKGELKHEWNKDVKQRCKELAEEERRFKIKLSIKPEEFSVPFTDEEIAEDEDRKVRKYAMIEARELNKERKEYEKVEENYQASIDETKRLIKENWIPYQIKRDENIEKLKEFNNYFKERNATNIKESYLSQDVLKNGKAKVKIFCKGYAGQYYYSKSYEIDEIINCKDFSELDLRFKRFKPSEIHKDKK